MHIPIHSTGQLLTILSDILQILLQSRTQQSYLRRKPKKIPLVEMQTMQTTQIVSTDTPDPWMIKYRGSYILTFTAGNRVELWRSSLLHDFHDNVTAKRVIWYILLLYH